MDDFPEFPDFPPGGFGDLFDDGAYWQEPDFLLSNLVSLMANKIDSQLGVTLLIKGAIMTGALVGEREYLHAINEMFKDLAKESLPEKPSSEEQQAIEDAFIFDQLTEDNYPDFDDEEFDLEGLEPAQIRHLHLKDPVIIFPSSALTLSESPLPIIRVRLAMVDGWMLGRMMMVSGEDMNDVDNMPDLPGSDITH